MRRMYQGNLPACNVVLMKPEDFKPIPRRETADITRSERNRRAFIIVTLVNVFIAGIGVGFGIASLLGGGQ